MLEETFPKTISFEVALENKAAVIDADKTQLHQTLLNLCVNARDAMPNGGMIAITMDQYSGAALRERFPDAPAPCYERVRVTDTGSGMDEQTMQRIFEPFFTTKTHGKGTGLGPRCGLRNPQEPSWIYRRGEPCRKGNNLQPLLSAPRSAVGESRPTARPKKKIPSPGEKKLCLW